MIPEHIALAQIEIAKLQLWVTSLAIFLGPLSGVIFTIWFQRRKDRKDQKQRLFVALMAHRKSSPPAFDLVNGLNLIDIVFSQHRQVVELWHQYYDLLCHDPVNWPLAEAKYLDLLYQMAKVLGHKNLAQTDISRFYSPIAHTNQAHLSISTQIELLRVLQNTASLSASPKSDISL